jgi:hypothetical protein
VHLDADEGNESRAIYHRKEEKMKPFTTIAVVINAKQPAILPIFHQLNSSRLGIIPEAGIQTW